MSATLAIIDTANNKIDSVVLKPGKLLVNYLPPYFRKEDVEYLVKDFGEVTSIEIINDSTSSGKSPGNYCVLEFETETATLNALKCKF